MPIVKQLIYNSKPFLKWAGGKGQLLSQLDDHLPTGLDEKDFTYIEPFVGGGAMLFHMLLKFPRIKRVVINDINPHLVTAYRTIKDLELIKRKIYELRGRKVMLDSDLAELYMEETKI